MIYLIFCSQNCRKITQKPIHFLTHTHTDAYIQLVLYLSLESRVSEAFDTCNFHCFSLQLH